MSIYFWDEKEEWGFEVFQLQVEKQNGIKIKTSLIDYLQNISTLYILWTSLN